MVRADRGEPDSRADRFFHVEWTAGPGGAGRTRITGDVYNDHGDSAVNVALRIHEIDASGQDIASVVAPVGETIPAHGQASLDVGVLRREGRGGRGLRARGPTMLDSRSDLWAVVLAGGEGVRLGTPEREARMLEATARRE